MELPVDESVGRGGGSAVTTGTIATPVVKKNVVDIDLRPYVFGGVAAICAEMVTFPLDTAKTRLQLQGQVSDQKWKVNRYRGTVHTIITIVREEGVTRIYKGLSPAIVRQAVYGTIKFGLYYSSKDMMKRILQTNKQKESTFVNLCCAVFAGCVSSSLANPTDVIKVRMQSGSGCVANAGLLSVASDIWQKEGVRGLWRGVCPTAQRSALVAGVQLPVYDWTKSKLRRSRWSVLQEGAPCHLLSSLIAGFTAALASNPVDVVRTRMMVQRKEHRLMLEKGAENSGQRVYSSAIQCIIQTVRTEGLMALYKGFIPAFARMGPWNIIFFVVYEKLKTL